MRLVSFFSRKARSPKGEDSIRNAPFYQRHPFSSPVQIGVADCRGMVDPDLRFFFNRLPKAANTSVAMTLLALRCGEQPLTRETKLRAKGKEFLRPKQLNELQVAALDNAFKFTMVRNPYSRVLSAYLDKVMRGRIAMPPAARSSFHSFCRYLAEEGLHDNAHWAPHISLLLFSPQMFDFIGRVETFDSDIMHVLTCIDGAGTKVRPVRYPGYPTWATSRLNDFYDATTTRIVASLYKDDFQAFGYSLTRWDRVDRDWGRSVRHRRTAVPFLHTSAPLLPIDRPARHEGHLHD